MGDAGVATVEDLALSAEVTGPGLDHETSPTREVTVLVTGFEPFKSFNINPSWLIASSLPAILQPQRASDKTGSLSPSPSPSPYVIRLIVHPTPVRVAYATAATLIPSLIEQHDPDYIVHIGMAAGREHYTLETIAHRDDYKIKDVDERDGWKEGEYVWKKEGIPGLLQVGWDEADVLARWEKEVNEVETALGLVEDEGPFPAWPLMAPHLRSTRKSLVRLSRDAGRFLCEFSLMVSLSRRSLEERQKETEGQPTDRRESREGKVAFLHVPGGFLPQDVARGVRVAEAAIRSIVASWEEGFRRHPGRESKGGGVEGGRWDGVVWKA